MVVPGVEKRILNGYTVYVLAHRAGWRVVGYICLKDMNAGVGVQ